MAANVRPDHPVSLKRVEFTAVNGFSADPFKVDGSGFQNPTKGGTWGLSATTGGLCLDFTPAEAPAPATLALIGLGRGLGAGLLARRRRAGPRSP